MCPFALPDYSKRGRIMTYTIKHRVFDRVQDGKWLWRWEPLEVFYDKAEAENALREHLTEPDLEGWLTLVENPHKATPIAGSVSVISDYHLDGHWHIEVPCPDDYDTFKALPSGLLYQGRTYGKSGFNSDRHIAYYNTRTQFACTL